MNMVKKLNPREQRNKITQASDALFGDPSEVDESEAEEMIAAAGLDASEMENRMYARLNAAAQHYWMNQQSVPPLLKRALEDMRPANAPARNEKELIKQAKSFVERIVETAKILPALAKYQKPSFATSYRNEKEITDSDKSLIDNAQTELEERLRKMGEQDEPQ